MNYNIRKTSQRTARLAFQILDEKCPTRFLKIWRIRKNPDSSISRAEGITIGENPNNSRAMVVMVRRGDVVVIVQQMPGDRACFLRHCKIAASFAPIAEDHRKLKERNAGALFENIEIESDRSSGLRETELRLLFGSRSPTWLHEIVEKQLDHYREHSVKDYLKLAPNHRIISELQLVVNYDSLRSLRDYKKHLTDAQIKRCIRKDPTAGMRYAFESVPRTLRRKHLVTHATHLLTNHLHQLTAAELRTCSKKSPQTAFLVRDRLTLRLRSIILARTYGVAWHTLIGDARFPFRDEILLSLTRHPEEWLAVAKNGFEEIFRRLSNLLDINLEHPEFEKLINDIEPQGKKALAEYIVAFV